jgi:heme exporter protein B
VAKTPGLAGAAWIVARKDLAIELRTRSAFLSVVMFTLLGLVIFFFAWDPSGVSALDLAPGVLWVTFTFAGLLGLHRSFGAEVQDRAIDALLVAPVEREAIYVGKAVANAILV